MRSEQSTVLTIGLKRRIVPSRKAWGCVKYKHLRLCRELLRFTSCIQGETELLEMLFINLSIVFFFAIRAFFRLHISSSVCQFAFCLHVSPVPRALVNALVSALVLCSSGRLQNQDIMNFEHFC